MGLQTVHLELGHVQLGQSLLEQVSPNIRPQVADALSKKDKSRLENILKQTVISRDLRSKLISLLQLYGSMDIMGEAKRLFTDRASRQALQRLTQIVDALGADDNQLTIGVDLGELKHWAYYTGVSFALLVEGPGKAIAEAADTISLWSALALKPLQQALLLISTVLNGPCTSVHKPKRNNSWQSLLWSELNGVTRAKAKLLTCMHRPRMSLFAMAAEPMQGTRWSLAAIALFYI
jgi:hypothetical protein